MIYNIGVENFVLCSLVLEIQVEKNVILVNKFLKSVFTFM